jgi:flagellar protein FliT
MTGMAHDALKQLLTLTQAIEAAAAQRDWPLAAALAGQQSELLKSLQPEQSAEALEIVNAIQRINANVGQQASTEKDALVERQGESVSRIKSVSLYQSTGML